MGGGDKKKNKKRHPHWCPELFCMIRPQRFGVYVVPPSKNGTDRVDTIERRLHQGGISGGTNVDVPTADLAAEAQQCWGWKPASGAVRLQTGGHARVSEKKPCSDGGRVLPRWPVPSATRGRTKEMEKMEYITPGPCGLPLVPLYGFRCTSVHKTQRQYWDYIKVVLFREWERGWLLMIFFFSPPPDTTRQSPTLPQTP